MKSNNLFIVMTFLIVLFNSIVYSALNSEMFINGDAHIRVDKDIRITDVKVLEQTNGSYETYNSDYSKNTTSMQVTLPSSESVMTYEVTITNKGDIDYELTNIVEESYSNSNIKYELIDIEKGTVMDGGTTHKFKIKLTTTENNSNNKVTLVLKYTFEERITSLYNMVAQKSRGLDTNIDFSVIPTEETSGVYEMDSTKEDEFPVYYYRGIIDNNNVSFAGFCWKIVRTTSTGGVKLIYSGVLANDESCSTISNGINYSIFNSGRTQKDISYMYENGTSSQIKQSIDKWYSENIIDYTDMLEDTIWCNDRTVYKTENNTIYFDPYRRIEESFTPSIKCSSIEDSFSVSIKNGNGLLTYPVALLTSDEIMLAGYSSKNGFNNGYLYIENEVSWTISPHNFYYQNGQYYVRITAMIDILYGGNAHSKALVRPAISLNNNTIIKTGNGSINEPYKLFTS